jgi:NitT/TauT family transport system substrate-binding protein
MPLRGLRRNFDIFHRPFHCEMKFKNDLQLRRIFLPFLVFGTIILVMNPSVSIDAQTNPSDRPVRILMHELWPPNFVLYLAEEKGLFEKNGVNVELLFEFDYLKVLDRYALGEADGMLLVFSDAFLQNAAGIDTKVVYTLDISQSGDAIIGKAKNLTELKGKKFGIDGVNSFSHLFTLKALEKAGLSEGDVQFANIPPADILPAIEKGEIDAGHTYSPFIALATSKGYNVLFTAKENPGIIADVLAFHRNILEERPTDIENIIKSFSEALDFYSKNTNEAVDIISAKSGLSREQIIQGFKGAKLMSLQDNVLVSMKNDPKNSSSLFASGEDISNFYVERGIMGEYPILAEIIEAKFVNDLYKKISSITD